MASYVCTSVVCEWRERCLLHKVFGIEKEVRVIFFCPPEERGDCPHRMFYKEKRDGTD